MKKFILFILLCLMLSGCSSNKTDEKPTVTPTITPTEELLTEEQLIELQQELLDEEKFSVSELPYKVKYNDKSISLKEVGYYSFKDGKSQELAVVLTFDIKKLSEDDIEWLLDDIETELYLTNKKNNINNRKMTKIGNLRYTDAKELLMIYVPNLWDGANRFAFEDCHIDISVKVKQLDTYELAGKEFNNNEYIDCYADITKEDIKPLSDVSYTFENFVYEKLQNYVNNVKDVLG